MVACEEITRDEGAEHHIARHGVSAEEVEEVLHGVTVQLGAPVRRLLVLGRTLAGRYLMVVLEAVTTAGDLCMVVTARDMTESERRLYRRRTRT
jgi:uncharacterized DUF497 family protein